MSSEQEGQLNTVEIELKTNIQEYLEAGTPRHDGTTRHTHVERMAGIFWGLVERGELPLNILPLMLDAILSHDLVDPLDIETGLEPVAIGQSSKKLIQRYLNYNNEPLDNSSYITKGEYVVGIIEAANNYEEQGEAWRKDVLEATQEILNDTSSKNSELVKTLLVKSIQRTNSNSLEPMEDEICNLAQEIQQLLTHFDKIHYSSNDRPISDNAWNFRCPMADIDSMVAALETNDLEGVILKAIELIDNLRNPNRANPASGWRDAQEIISFYAPLVELMGFNEMAQDIASVGYEYLNNKGYPLSYDPKSGMFEIPELKNGYNDKRIADLADIQTERSLGYAMEARNSALPDFKLIKQALLDEEGKYITIDIKGQKYEVEAVRLKSPGSRVEKMVTSKNQNVPDDIGIRIRRSQRFDSAQDLYEQSQAVLDGIISKFSGNGVKLSKGHTRENEAPVEVTYGDQKERIDLVDDKNNVLAELKGARPSGYEAGHFSYYLIINGRKIGVEIQITDRDSADTRDKGIASHVFYKAKQAFGPFGEIMRSSDKAKILQEKQRVIEKLQSSVYGRRESFFKGNISLTPKLVDEVRNKYQ